MQTSLPKVFIALLVFIIIISLSNAAPPVAQPQDSNAYHSPSSSNITTREDVHYANYDAIDVKGLCTKSKPGQCYFVTWTHFPTGDLLEYADHAFYAFDPDCKTMGYSSAVNIKGFDKYAFGPPETNLQYTIDVRFSPKKDYGWAPKIWYAGRRFTDSSCYYYETSSNWRHSQGFCRVSFRCEYNWEAV